MVSLADIHISRESDYDRADASEQAHEQCQPTAPHTPGTDERRMQVRAYNHWLAGIAGEELPAIEELRPEALADLGPNSVLVDLTLGLTRPVIAFLGERLEAECGEDREIFAIGDVPERSLLSRLTEHCLEVVANRAPVGFDAEFEDRSGRSLLYRSILLPYSSDGQTIDFVFGVISWKEGTSPVASAAAPVPNQIPDQSLADIPGGETAEDRADNSIEPSVAAQPGLADLLAAAREAAQSARNQEGRSRDALYTALSRLHDLSLRADAHPGGVTAWLASHYGADTGRSTNVALARLVFGADHNKTRLAEYGAALDHARRFGIGAGNLYTALQTSPGGLKAVVAAERRLRRGDAPAPSRALRKGIAARLRRLASRHPADVVQDQGEFVLLVARRNFDRPIAVLGAAGNDPVLVEKAAKRLLAA